MIDNDYELVYLIQSEHDPIAYERLVNKYRNLIYKSIHQIGLNANEIDDFFQEGLMILDKAIYLFDERYDKTFTKYFELVLKRRFIHLKRNEPKYYLMEDSCMIEDYSRPQWDLGFIDVSFDSQLERKIHNLYFVEKYTINQICQKENLDKKQVYNAIHRIKKKYKAVV